MPKPLLNPESPPPAKAPIIKAKPLLKPLKGIRILSLALNLPGPAALMRCKNMGATCVKLEPPGQDPMTHLSPAAYAELHVGMKILRADLKTGAGQQQLHHELARADVLITSFRPSALEKLGLNWKKLHRLYPALSQIAIVGCEGERAEEPGHDLTYMAENDLVTGLHLPPTLYADMGGSLMASEAVLQAVMAQRLEGKNKGKGVLLEIGLAEAARYLALPRQWGLTQASGMVGGAHAGYGVYPCKNGRVAVAALEPHFAARLCEAIGFKSTTMKAMETPAARKAIGAFFLTQTRAQLNRLALAKDIPLHTLGKETVKH